MAPDVDKPGGLGRFLGALLVVWLLAWLPLGLLKGDPDFVLTAVSRGTPERQLYQGLLYGGLLLVFLDAWRRRPPSRPAWGLPGDFARYAVLGLLSALVLRAVLWGLGARDIPGPPDLSVQAVLLALASAVVVAVAEEAVFRGFLLGRLAEKWGPTAGLWLSSGLFATVHLFRPGSLPFKAAYAVGLLLLAGLLGRIAWRRNIAASAGFHGGVIWPNLLDPTVDLSQSWWAGWQGEPASGLLAWALTAALWGQWEWAQNQNENL